MNDQMQDFARSTLKDGLVKLPESWQAMFKRMYSPNDLSANIEDVVNMVPASKLDWAMQQVQRSLDKQA